jgi:hypothetical protein
VAALAGGAVLAVPVLGNDTVGAGLLVLAGGIAVAGHASGPARRHLVRLGGVGLAGLAVLSGLLRGGVAQTAARALGADVFGWRSPWLVTAVVALGAVVAVATVVVPGEPSGEASAGSTEAPESGGGPQAARGAGAAPAAAAAAAGTRGPAEHSGAWALLLAGLLAVALHRDGTATGALLLVQLAALAALVAVRAGDPQPLVLSAEPYEGRRQHAPAPA